MSKPKAAAISRDKWIHAIQSNAGVLMFIATELGLNRHTVARYRDKHEWVQRAFKEAVEMAVDAAEFCVLTKAAVNPKVAMWLLDRKAKDRGYGTQMQIDGKLDTGPQVVLYLPSNGRENPEEPDKVPE